MNRVTADAWSDPIIGSHSHVGSQALGDVRHRLVDVFLWQFFPDCLQGDFPPSVVLGFGWSLWYFSSMATVI